MSLYFEHWDQHSRLGPLDRGRLWAPVHPVSPVGCLKNLKPSHTELLLFPPKSCSSHGPPIAVNGNSILSVVQVLFHSLHHCSLTPHPTGQEILSAPTSRYNLACLCFSPLLPQSSPAHLHVSFCAPTFPFAACSHWVQRDLLHMSHNGTRSAASPATE